MASAAHNSDEYDDELQTFDQMWFMYSRMFPNVYNNPRKLSLIILGVLFAAENFKLYSDAKNAEFVTIIPNIDWANCGSPKVVLNFDRKNPPTRFSIKQYIKDNTTATDPQYVFEITCMELVQLKKNEPKHTIRREISKQKYWQIKNEDGTENMVVTEGNLGSVMILKSELSVLKSDVPQVLRLIGIAARFLKALKEKDDTDDETEPDFLNNTDGLDNTSSQDDTDDETEPHRRFG